MNSPICKYFWCLPNSSFIAHHSSLKMSVVIGCSGSTGSSLLKTILNRHSQIFAGPEAALFAFPQVYDNWKVCKKQLLKGIKNEDWQLRKGMVLLQPEFGWKREELAQVI